MGFTPQQVNDMTFWEFNSAAEGYDIGNGLSSPEKKFPTEKEFHTALANIERGKLH